jgi:hypothetical protein
MKGFSYGIAVVAIALFFGFGGGVLTADWLTRDTTRHSSRIERVKASEANAVKSADSQPAENPLTPKKVVTQEIAAPQAKQPDTLPLSHEPLGPSRPFSPSVNEPAPLDANVRQMPDERIRELQPTTANRREVVPAEIYRPSPQLRSVSRTTKREKAPSERNRQKFEKPELETTGVAIIADETEDDSKQRPKAQKSENRRRARISSEPEGVPPTTQVIRPLFGLFEF